MRIHELLRFLAAPWTILFFFCGSIVGFLGFSWQTSQLGDRKSPDATICLTHQDVANYLRDIGPDGRRLYAWTECSLDLVFPFIYTGLFAGLIIRSFPKRVADWLVALPLFALVGDLSENAHFAVMSWEPGLVDDLYCSAAFFHHVKFVCIGLAVPILVLRWIWLLLRCILGFSLVQANVDASPELQIPKPLQGE
jgi:hypothetical protein